MPHDEALTAAMQLKPKHYDVAVYPNPVLGDELHVVVFSSRIKVSSDIYVIDMLGRQVGNMSRRLEHGMNHFSLPLDPQLPAGVYQVVMYETDRIGIAKFVKQ